MTKKILFVCGRELNYQRNSVILNALKTNGYEVTVLEYKGKTQSILNRSAHLGLQLINILSKRDFDYIYVGFYGYFLIHIARSLSKSPILFDPFVSNFETLIEDRKVGSLKSPLAKAAYLLDRFSLQRSHHNILDTTAHIEYFCNTFGTSINNYSRIFVGCDENLFMPNNANSEGNEVLFYGSYQPLHGVETIIRAASYFVGDEKVRFRIVGDGKDKKKIQLLASNLGLSNLIFETSVPLSNLPKLISNAKICLGGPFGPSEKANRVITGKTFQCLAMGRATIVGKNLANKELLEHGIDALFCKLNDPADLANQISYLLKNEDHRRDISLNARETFIRKASLNVLSMQIREVFETKI